MFPRCPRCRRSVPWFEIVRLTRHYAVRCAGCGSELAMTAQTRWYILVLMWLLVLTVVATPFSDTPGVTAVVGAALVGVIAVIWASSPLEPVEEDEDSGEAPPP